MRKIFFVLAVGILFSACQGEISGLTENYENNGLSQDVEDNVEVSLLQSDFIKYDMTDKSDRIHQIVLEKSHNVKQGVVELVSYLPDLYKDDYTLLPEEFYSMDNQSLSFSEKETRKSFNLKLSNLPSIDVTKKYILGIKLQSSDFLINEKKDSVVFTLSFPEGSKENPYIIKTPAHLLQIQDNLQENATTYFKLNNDIDMSGIEWTPIETTKTKKIAIDGQGYSIKKLKCQTSSSAYQGFFGLLIGECKNLNFIDANILANQKMTGIVAGQVGKIDAKGVVENVNVSGNVDVKSGTAEAYLTAQAGGITGKLAGNESRITYCSSRGKVKADWSAGGLIGEIANFAVLSQSYSQAEVEALQVAGGLCGNMFKGKINNCYSLGTVKALGYNIDITPRIEGRAGGIAGRMDCDNTIEICYSTSQVSVYRHAGGIVGKIDNPGNSIKKTIAWNDKLTASNEVGVVASGRISGHLKNVSNLIGESCYAKKDMQILINNVSRFDPHTLHTTVDDVRFYDGESTDNIITTAETTLSWDTEIWDFSSELPKLKWHSDN